jgi:hypothetical protein
MQKDGFMKQQESLIYSNSRKSPAVSAVSTRLILVTRSAILITLGIGMYLHFTRLFLGSELLIKYIYTATFDMAFSIPMLIGLLGFLPTWKHIVFRNRFEKVVVAATGIMFLLSVPLHIQTWYTQSTDYILAFPMMYSLIFLAYSSVMVFVWSRLKIMT